MEPFDVATTRYPLRASSLTRLCKCPGWFLLDDPRILATERDVGKAADTGTATGRLVELYHQGLAVGEALAKVDLERATGVRGKHPFPLADMDAAEGWFRQYADDPRNPRSVVVTDSLEARVTLTLPPAPEDPTGQPVVIVGHLDQIRQDHLGNWRLWDVKTGRDPGLNLLYTHAWQIAAYALGSTEKYGKPVLPGGIIRMRGYHRKRDPGECNAFFAAPWTLDHCRAMMASAVQHVAWIRSGIIHLHPGVYCQYCPAESPHLCGDRLTEALDTKGQN